MDTPKDSVVSQSQTTMMQMNDSDQISPEFINNHALSNANTFGRDMNHRYNTNHHEESIREYVSESNQELVNFNETMWFPTNQSNVQLGDPQVSPSPKANEPYFKILNRHKDYQTNHDHNFQESVMVNPIYLVTQSTSFENGKYRRKIKLPITRHPVKDFSSTYLSPKMWPTTKGSRLKNSRGSMLPAHTKPLNIANFSTNRDGFNNTHSRSGLKITKTDILDDKVPLIFADKPDYNTNSTRKLRPWRSIDAKQSNLSDRLSSELKSKLCVAQNEFISKLENKNSYPSQLISLTKLKQSKSESRFTQNPPQSKTPVLRNLHTEIQDDVSSNVETRKASYVGHPGHPNKTYDE